MYVTLGQAVRQSGSISRAIRHGKLSAVVSGTTLIQRLQRYLSATAVARATAETVSLTQAAPPAAATAALEAELADLRRIGELLLAGQLDPPAIKVAAPRLACTACGAEANAACTCGVTYAA